MLIVVEVAEPSQETVLIGEYVPLTLEWPQFAPPAPYFWRATPDSRSLLEVGVHPETARICWISVILPGRAVELVMNPVAPRARPEEFGHPVCDLGRWKNGWMSDEPVSFRLVVNARSVSVWFVPTEEAAVDLRSGTVRFHLSAHREVVGFTVQLPPDELRRLKETLSWIAENRLPDDG
jgi:hypothetical protein